MPQQWLHISGQAAVGSHVQGGLRVALETGSESTWLYHLLVEPGTQVTVAEPMRMPDS